MANPEKAVSYKDKIGYLPDGQIFYPESLRQILPALAELNREDMRDRESYSANIGLELDLIVGYFRSIHLTHRTALETFEKYRTEGRQYCLYLRSFNWAGELSGEESRYAFLDQNFRTFLKESLPPGTATLSFVNMLDQYPRNESAEEADYMARATIPSLRVLSHNWKDVVREVIRGARMVVFNTRGESDGISYEADLLSECHMESRTVVTGAGIQSSGIASTGRFAGVMDRGAGWLPLTGASARRLAHTIRSLATDDFTQTNHVRDLSELPCWVLDRNIEIARTRFSAEDLAGIPYDLYIPSSLLNNWTVLTGIYPEMAKSWTEILNRGRNTGRGREELPHILDVAVHVFWVAATLERYYEMAMSLSVIGMAHSLITGESDLMVKCYGHAVNCALWSGDTALTDFLTQAYSELSGKAAGTKSD